MNNVIFVDFGQPKPVITDYSVDIYCASKKVYQLDMSENHIDSVLTEAIEEASLFNLGRIIEVVLFEGLIAQRQKRQARLKEWSEEEIEAAMR